ncbi:MAG: DsbA family protein [Pseudomonadota bacterium]
MLKTLPFLRRAASVSLAGLASLALASCGGDSNAASSPSGSSATETATEASETDMVLGDPDAPVTLVEFASVTCPACAAFHSQVLPEIKEKYVDTGKVKLVFREFPTAPVEWFLKGSLLARCVGETSGKEGYFAVIGSLMDNQRDWVPQGVDHKAELLKIASQAGLDEAGFDACAAREDFVDLIANNVAEAEKALKISGTPSFFIDGESVRPRNMKEWTEALDAAYASATGGEAG